MRKKLTGFFAVFACLLILTACGSTASETETQEVPQETQSLLYSNTEMTIQQMDQIVTGGMVEEQKDYAVIYSGLQSWQSAKDEIGEVDFTTDADGNGSADCFISRSITIDDDKNYVVSVTVQGAQKTADCIISYNKDLSDYAHIVTNVNYSFGELMQQAGLNTLLGMGTTFFVLILLSLIIAGFGKIFTSIDLKKRQKDAEKDKAAPAAAAAPAPAVKQGSLAAQESDDALIAVIAAAVSAYREQAEPTVAPDGFVVRKIRRIGRK